jgi:hypothetical protein
MRTIDVAFLQDALKQVFKVRATHPLPEQLNLPPDSWEIPFKELAKECLLMMGLNEAYSEVAKVYATIRSENKEFKPAGIKIEANS